MADATDLKSVGL